MKILLFGISNVGKTTCGKILSKSIGYDFFDLDEEVKKYYNTSLEDFVNSDNLYERDKKRGLVAENVLKNNNIVFAITPISYLEFFENILNGPDVLAIELIDTVENVFNRLVFCDENDEIYEDREYCEKHKNYYLSEIYKDLVWYGNIYQNIENKYFINGKTPQEVVDEIISQYQIER